jgi:uncharacterized protein YjiK
MIFFKKLPKGWNTALVLLLLAGCKPKIIELKSPPHYDFSKVYTDKFDIDLREISGIVWDRKKDEFIAHNDEKGVLFFLDKDTRIIKREFSFGGKGDYEDVAIYRNMIFVLRSDGLLKKIVTDSAGKMLALDAGKLPLSGTNDFETLYFDESRNALIMICKNCASDNKSTVSAFAYYPDSIGFDENPVFRIDADLVRSLAPKKTSKFQPSAAAVHPVLKKLFILSSASNQLAIADLNGIVESVYVLGNKLFPQPEGITFRNNGDMFISNEGVTSKGTLLKFAYLP